VKPRFCACYGVSGVNSLAGSRINELYDGTETGFSRAFIAGLDGLKKLLHAGTNPTLDHVIVNPALLALSMTLF